MTHPTTLSVQSPPMVEPRPVIDRYLTIRRFTEQLCASLEPEDMVVQTVVDVSPTKWHLAHTAWFFETFVLREALPDYENPVPEYAFLFNSYYQAAGPMHCRAQRGAISRPTVGQVFEYRAAVDDAMLDFMSAAPESEFARWLPVIETGLNHEQQHQELLLMDIKHVFAQNPLRPALIENPRKVAKGDAARPGPVRWVECPGGLFEVGHTGEGFHYDNEGPRHRTFLEPYALADRLVTNGDYLAFIEDGGYQRPEFWLSMGWATAQAEGWHAPLYWERDNNAWQIFTLGGLRDLDLREPVCHVSFFEAAAYARWAGARLPEEAEWEVAFRDQISAGNFVESGFYHPVPLRAEGGAFPLRQGFGDVWEWTRSSYAPYPGYEAASGALGEYNGKFMCNQYVLRGGCCATAQSHMRPTYRNFFLPEKRWQFSGIRLARDLS